MLLEEDILLILHKVILFSRFFYLITRGDVVQVLEFLQNIIWQVHVSNSLLWYAGQLRLLQVCRGQTVQSVLAVLSVYNNVHCKLT